MSLVERLLKTGLSPKHIGYLGRLLSLKMRYRNRISWQSLTVSIQRSARVTIEGDGRIRFGSWAHVKRGCDLEAHPRAVISIGDRFFMNKNSSIIARYGVEIGSDCLIADHVSIYDHNHEFRSPGAVTRDQGFAGSPIRIGNNVWIGSKTFIGAGVQIGDNVVIGANSIIVKDVPPNTIAYNRVSLVLKPLREGGFKASSPL